MNLYIIVVEREREGERVTETYIHWLSQLMESYLSFYSKKISLQLNKIKLRKKNF